MSRDASLDEFFESAESEAQTDEGDVSESDQDDGKSGEAIEASMVESEDHGSDEVEDPVEAEDEGAEISPASPTYVWTPARVACARCGSSVDRLWRCEGELVCGECKEW